MYRDNTLEKYLIDLSVKIPAPGGGSAAAMTAAMAAALISMVVNFTLGKPKYARFENELAVILEQSEKLRLEFLDLVDLDVAAFKSKNLRDCLDVPFMCARLCFEGIKLCPKLIKRGNTNLISDVGAAAVLFEAGFASACVNVRINLRAIKDKSLARKINRELNQKAKSAAKIRLETEAKVGQIIRGETGR